MEAEVVRPVRSNHQLAGHQWLTRESSLQTRNTWALLQSGRKNKLKVSTRGATTYSEQSGLCVNIAS